MIYLMVDDYYYRGIIDWKDYSDRKRQRRDDCIITLLIGEEESFSLWLRIWRD